MSSSSSNSSVSGRGIVSQEVEVTSKYAKDELCFRITGESMNVNGEGSASSLVTSCSSTSAEEAYPESQTGEQSLAVEASSGWIKMPASPSTSMLRTVEAAASSKDEEERGGSRTSIMGGEVVASAAESMSVTIDSGDSSSDFSDSVVVVVVDVDTSWEWVSSFSDSGASESADAGADVDEGGGGRDNFRLFLSRFGNVKDAEGWKR